MGWLIIGKNAPAASDLGSEETMLLIYHYRVWGDNRSAFPALSADFAYVACTIRSTRSLSTSRRIRIVRTSVLVEVPGDSGA
jgi:hypothetical protein